MWRIDQGVRLSRAVVLLNGNTNSYGLYSDFGEAMRVTQAAKRDFPRDTLDLFSRGARIIRESVEYGVTAMRAHVEIDTTVRFSCLEAAERLQREYHLLCDVQLAGKLLHCPDRYLGLSLMKMGTVWSCSLRATTTLRLRGQWDPRRELLPSQAGRPAS